MATKENKKVNSYIIYDWESSGLSSQKNAVMELAMIAINGKTLENIIAYDNLVKPYDEKLVYEPAAMKVNGLSIAQCENDGVELKELVVDMIQVFEEANVHKSKVQLPLLVAHNGGFDAPFMEDVFKRCGKDLSKYVAGWTDESGKWRPRFIDTIDLAKMVHGDLADGTDDFKMNSCCERAGIQMADGHRAMNDVIALADLFRYYVMRLRSGSNEILVGEEETKISHRNKFEW